MTDRVYQERVRLEIKEQIAFVTLVRSNKMNALDMAMFESIVKVTKDLKKDKSIRAVILSGEGDAFCTGLDIKSVLKTLLRRSNYW